MRTVVQQVVAVLSVRRHPALQEVAELDLPERVLDEAASREGRLQRGQRRQERPRAPIGGTRGAPTTAKGGEGSGGAASRQRRGTHVAADAEHFSAVPVRPRAVHRVKELNHRQQSHSSHLNPRMTTRMA